MNSEINDPDSFVVFQSDHNWIMSKTIDEKKLIFNLVKKKTNCKINKDINLHNVNILRLIFLFVTGNQAKFLDF